MNIVKFPIKIRRDDRPDTDHDSGYFPRIFELFFQHDLISTKLEIALEMLSGHRYDYSAAPSNYCFGHNESSLLLCPASNE